jgi:hypothetical protein
MFRIRERMHLQIRAEFFNVFNRTVFPAISGNNPVTTASRDGLGATLPLWLLQPGHRQNVQTGGMIPTSGNGQLVARFEW